MTQPNVVSLPFMLFLLFLLLNNTGSIHSSSLDNYNNNSFKEFEASILKDYEHLKKVYEIVREVREWYLTFGTLITICGLIMNVLCIIIFFKSKLFRQSSFPYYVYVISIVDMANILMRFAIPQSIENGIRSSIHTKFNMSMDEFNLDKYQYYTSNITSNYHCSVFMYAHNSLTLVSVWLMAAVSLERWLVIKFTIQSKRMLKWRAFFILSFILVSIFGLNVFDLAPGFYIKPTWFANLTLLCERDDTLEHIFINGTITPTKAYYYKTLGGFTFNTNYFFLVRMLLQTVVPFLVVLVFNSLIIYNFKRIKSAALGRRKSNSFISVNSFSDNKTFNDNNHYTKTPRHKSRRSTHAFIDNKNNNNQHGVSHLRIPKRSSKSLTPNIISRSPSPFSIPTTPLSNGTSNNLVAALNLDKSSPCSSPSKKFLKNSSAAAYLAPPNHFFSSVNSSPNHSGCSSANLSVLTSKNCSINTEKTNVNSEQTGQNVNNIKDHSSNIENLSFIITPISPSLDKSNMCTTLNRAGTKKSTTTQTINRVSFKNRSFSSRNRLNRETDIMLIVLSFSILISQLPCTVLTYLIYYMNILSEKWMSVFLPSYTPAILMVIRLLEMVYFSLNFIFYITLSPSLRKEIRVYIRHLVKRLRTRNNYFKSSIMLTGNKNNNNNNYNSSPSLIVHNNFLGFNLNNHGNSSRSRSNNRNNKIDLNNKKRMFSNNSSGTDYIDYLDRLRSISPLHRPNVFLCSNNTNNSSSNSTNSERTKPKKQSKCKNRSKESLSRKNNKSEKRASFIQFLLNLSKNSRSSKSNLSNSNENDLFKSNTSNFNQIKIVINNLHDEVCHDELHNDEEFHHNKTNNNKANNSVKFHLENDSQQNS
jgi:hypothetical protein